MNSKSRTENSIRNASTAIGCQFVTLFISFLSRKLFIKILGSQYLGVNGLFTNILSILSLADLGFSWAIAYSLYKPIAENDEDRISAIVRYFGKVYRIVAFTIFIVGLAFIPFLDILISSEITISNVRFYYLLYLIETASSYLFVYKSILLSADQRQYVTKWINTFFVLVTNVVKIIVLYITNNFTAYLIIQIIGGIVTNFVISKKTDEQYPFLQTNQTQLDDSSKNIIFLDVKALFIYKIGSVIMYHTDNILISIMVSTTNVGYYSNYTMLTGAITTLSELLFGSLGASIGNKNATSKKEELLKIFNLINFACFWVYGFCSICLFCLMDDFIELWAGKEYVLGTLASFIISFNVFIPGMLSAVSSFRNATGLFRQTKYIYLITAILNLCLSIVFGKYFGLVGILLATGISRLLTNVWYEPYVLIRDVFNDSYIKYIFKIGLYYLCFIIPCIIILTIKNRIFVLSPLNFIVETIVCSVCVNLLYYIIFRKTFEFNDLKNRITIVIKKYISK